MSDAFRRVVESYHRCRSGGRFFDAFYERFLGSSPEIARMFRNTDFAHQKRMLKLSLLEMLNFAQGVEAAVVEIEHLGVIHRELGVTQAHYDLWLDTLCAVIAEHDPEATPALEADWRAALEPGIAAMLQSES